MSGSDSAAVSLTAFFPGEGRPADQTQSANGFGFHFVVDGTIQTLSSRGSPDQPRIGGFLFVPSLDAQDPCNRLIAPFLPANVTKLNGVSTSDNSGLIALAPWVGFGCAGPFLAAAHNVQTTALVFYQPENPDPRKPPAAGDPVWTADDGGAWEIESDFPVYAIPGPAGNTLMHELSLSLSSAPRSQQEPWGGPDGFLGSGENTRLFSIIQLDNNSSDAIPSLWGITLVILGSLVIAVVFIAVCYRLIQSRRRRRFSVQFEGREISTDSLALDLAKVPKEFLDTFPRYLYRSLTVPDKTVSEPDTIQACEVVKKRHEEQPDTACFWASDASLSRTSSNAESIPVAATVTVTKPEPVVIANEVSSPGSTPGGDYHPGSSRPNLAQTTCAICLDDFTEGTSTVRELPCSHIFHSECIDPFLLTISSLCPLCKSNVLPVGMQRRSLLIDEAVLADYRRLQRIEGRPVSTPTY